ncbi:MAG TPA: alpha/beta hydrolase [Thermomicrobiales bacterium]|nr:alpha/beta hydrolase [Thermomicrobiales bacterium]
MADANAITERDVDLRGRAVSLRTAGAEAGPALVLLHGIPTSSYLWRRCLPSLAAMLPGRRILAPDLPGYGRSEARPGAGPRHLGRFLDALLREVGVAEFALAGHDLGGLVALTYAVSHARATGAPRLTHLILLDTTIYPAPLLVLGLLPALVPPIAEVSFVWLARQDEAARRRRHTAGLRALLAPGTALTPADEAEYSAPYAGMAGWREARRSVRALAGQAGFVLRCLVRLGDVTVPTALLWGERDPFFPLATAERLRRAIPGAREPVHVVRGAGHFVPEDRPEEVADAIAAFLTRFDQS